MFRLALVPFLYVVIDIHTDLSLTLLLVNIGLGLPASGARSRMEPIKYRR